MVQNKQGVWDSTKPIDLVRRFHNAFRRDMLEIDGSALKVARNGGDVAQVLNRVHTMGEFLESHARGEEDAVFPVFEKIRPSTVETYFLDHRELDMMVNGLEAMRAAPDALVVTRATAALQSHLRIHLYKEDAYLYPALRERTTVDEQAAIVGTMANSVPRDKNHVLVQWLFPLLSNDDRAVVTRGWMALMPPKVFSGLLQIIKETVGREWVDLTKQVPKLE